MTSRRLLFLFTVTWMSAQAQPTLTVDSMFSPSVGKVKKFSVYLPEAYASTAKYPVLYLLHGYSGDYTDWSKRTRLAMFLKGVPLIVVMPDAEDSWYVNSATSPARRFEDYIINDLPKYVNAHYAVDSTRQAIAGLSMGGYGATMLAMKHPGRFRFAASLSGALTYPRFLEDTLMQPVSQRFRSNLLDAFGPSSGGHRIPYDLFVIFQGSRHRTDVHYYFVAGIQDEFQSFLPSHRMLVALLRANNVSYEYHEVPGRHNWEFWDREIQPVLVRMREVMNF